MCESYNTLLARTLSHIKKIGRQKSRIVSRSTLHLSFVSLRSINHATRTNWPSLLALGGDHEHPHEGCWRTLAAAAAAVCLKQMNGCWEENRGVWSKSSLRGSHFPRFIPNSFYVPKVTTLEIGPVPHFFGGAVRAHGRLAHTCTKRYQVLVPGGGDYGETFMIFLLHSMMSARYL
jgi:hypothetical protein